MMNTVIILVLLILSFFANLFLLHLIRVKNSFNSYITDRTIRMLYKENNKLQNENHNLRIRIDSLKVDNTILSRAVNNKSYRHQDEIKEAIRFAMIQAHPDNPNGSKEKFIKYKKIYDEL